MKAWLTFVFSLSLTIALTGFLSDKNSGGIQGSLTSRGKTLSFISPTPSSSSSVTYLPQTGPYASLGQVDVTTLSDLTVSSNTSIPSSTQAVPLKYKTLTINSTRSWSASTTNGYQAYIWCNTLVLNGTLDVSGQNGQTTNDPNTGGDGGDGAEGGQGGQGVVTNGNDGTTSFHAPTYGFNNGGDGSADSAAPGRGGSGSQDGGDGGVSMAAGGGGGAGGLISIACNTITGAATGHLNSNGGSEGLDSGSNLFNFGAGGGVIWLAGKSYNGLISTSNVSVSGGNGAGSGSKTIYQINSDNSLTSKAFNQSW